MIFVSVGTDHHPFDRLLDWAARAHDSSGIDVIVQRGATADRRDLGIGTFDYAPMTEIESHMRAADAVVCHGGPGTIALAQRCGHRPIVVPRDPSRGEHVDDHQMRYCARLATGGEIDLADDVDELLDLLSNPRPRIDVSETDDHSTEAVDAFSAIVEDLLAGRLSRRPWRDRLVLKRSP